jgi:hypothetical protein
MFLGIVVTGATRTVLATPAHARHAASVGSEFLNGA